MFVFCTKRITAIFDTSHISESHKFKKTKMANSKFATNYEEVLRICNDRISLILWLRERNLMHNYCGICEFCNRGDVRVVIDRTYSKDEMVFRCNNTRCKKRSSIRRDSWFSGSHLPLETILKLTYYWVYKTPNEVITRELRIGSKHTVVDWRNFCRDVCIDICMRNSKKIGGPGRVVEIDESKFGKRKYNRGRRVDGAWVFGGIDRESKECFFEIVEDRSAETLIPIIERNVARGSEIHSDCWKAYARLGSLGYVHKTVNHSKEFVNPETGAYTQNIESTWHVLKKSLPVYGCRKDLYESYFEEFVVRRKFLSDAADPFLKFLELVADVYPKKARVPTEMVLSDSMEY